MRTNLLKLNPFEEVTVFRGHGGVTHVVAEVIEVECQSITVRVLRSMGEEWHKPGDIIELNGKNQFLVTCEASVFDRPLVEEGCTSPTLYLNVSTVTHPNRLLRLRKLEDDITVEVTHLKGKNLVYGPTHDLQMDFSLWSKFSVNMEYCMRYGWSDQ
jgi:hypothetical protein